MNKLILNLKKLLLTRRGLMLLLLPFVVAGTIFLYQKNHVKDIYAVDPLIVTYNGGPPPNPMFNVSGLIPGDEVEKTFNVKNDSPDAVNVVMDLTKTDELKNFASILDVVVTELPSTVVYSGKLQALFDAPPISLGSFPAGVAKDYKFKVTFPVEAGDEFQSAKVVFDIFWGAKIDLPPECAPLADKITKVVKGTEGNDKIHATIASELILAYGGNDKVDASSGDDCVVLGDGNDQLSATSGNDIILGGGGNDKIDAGTGNDVVYGGDGNDDIKAGQGNDTVYGGEGNDNIDLGTGNDKAWGDAGMDSLDGGDNDDELHGGAGNDTLRGGSGNDKLYGDEGNDNIHAGSGNDLLDGGADTDDLHGDSGTDTCTLGESLSSCEL